MPRPRLPEIPYTTPTASELKSGAFGTCLDCAQKWPLPLFAARSKRCLNCARAFYREQTETKSSLNQLSVSPERRAAALALQKNMCPVCKKPLGASERSTHADHDHTTGLFRGFLCRSCNLGLGFFRDDPELILKAATYIENHRARAAKGGRHPAERDVTREELRKLDLEVAKLLMKVPATFQPNQDGVGFTIKYDVKAIRAVLNGATEDLTPFAQAQAKKLAVADWSPELVKDLSAVLAHYRAAIVRGDQPNPLPRSTWSRLYGSASDPLISISEAASYFGVTTATANAWSRAGILPTVTAGGKKEKWRRVRVAVVEKIKSAAGTHAVTAHLIRNLDLAHGDA